MNERHSVWQRQLNKERAESYPAVGVMNMVLFIIMLT